MYYVITVKISAILIAVFVSVFAHAPFFTVLLYTALAVVCVVAVDGLTAALMRLLPEKCADQEKKIYRVSAKEKEVYEKLKIRAWKEKVPELGHLTGFRKNKIVDPKSVEYLDRFLLEICYGQIVHFVSCFSGCLIFALSFLYPLWWVICMPVAVINAFLNWLPLIVLRYNSYKLRILKKNLQKKKYN